MIYFGTNSSDAKAQLVLVMCRLFQEPDVDLEDSGDVLVLTSVTRKDSGIYQCRPQDADAAAEVRGDMQLAVHCEEDTQVEQT